MFGMVPFKNSVPVRQSDRGFFSPFANWDSIFDGFDMSFSDRTFMPSIDVHEDDNALSITAELPGMKEEDINLSLSKNMLTLSGEKKEEFEDKQKNSYRMERRYGSFSRTVVLPEGIDDDKIQATYKNGVLSVVVPKQPGAGGNKRIEIKAEPTGQDNATKDATIEEKPSNAGS